MCGCLSCVASETCGLLSRRLDSMNLKQLLRTALVVMLLAAASVAQKGVGAPLPATQLEGFSQTKAKSLDDYAGRALLIEIFAYW
jgi:hypothetical protein